MSQRSRDMVPRKQRVYRTEPSRFLSAFLERLEGLITPLAVLAFMLGRNARRHRRDRSCLRRGAAAIMRARAEDGGI